MFPRLYIYSVSVAADCKNPVFSASASWGDASASITVEGTQATVPEDTTVCVAYKGQDSCCSASTLASIEKSITRASEKIAATREKVAKFDPEKEYSNIEAIAKLCQVLPADEEAECQTKINNQITKIKQISKDLANAGLNCADIMLGYKAGMLCFACAADWEDKVQASENKIVVAQNTCDRVSSTCSPMMEKSHELIVAIADLLETVFNYSQLKVLAGLIKAGVDNMKDYCEGTKDTKGDCTKIVCDKWLSGLHGNINAISNARRVLAEQTVDMDVDPEIVDFADNLFDTYERLLSQFDDSEDEHAIYHGRMLKGNINTYSTSGGVDPVKDGCQEPGVNCPSNNTWLFIGVGAVALVVVGAAGFFIYKKKSVAGNKV